MFFFEVGEDVQVVLREVDEALAVLLAKDSVAGAGLGQGGLPLVFEPGARRQRQLCEGPPSVRA